VFETQGFILGPEVEKFEKEVAAFCGARFGVGLSSGTDSLLAALMALGLSPGDEVITTPYTFFSTAGAIARLQGIPVFVDIDPKTFNIDPGSILEKVTSRTKIILPVHLFGRCSEMDSILAIGKEKNIRIVEDAAQAIGSFDAKGRKAGCMGQIGCFSFFPSKNLGGFGDGGMAVTNDETLSETLRVLRVHGSKPKYFHKAIGGNFRLDALQAVILSVKLKFLEEWTNKRRSNTEYYRYLFKEKNLLNSITYPEEVPGHVYNQFIIRSSERDGLRIHLKEQGIATEIYYPLPLHLQECFSYLNYKKGDFPHSEEASRETLALPIYPELSRDQMEYVVERIEGFIKR